MSTKGVTSRTPSTCQTSRHCSISSFTIPSLTTRIAQQSSFTASSLHIVPQQCIVLCAVSIALFTSILKCAFLSSTFFMVDTRPFLNHTLTCVCLELTCPCIALKRGLMITARLCTCVFMQRVLVLCLVFCFCFSCFVCSYQLWVCANNSNILFPFCNFVIFSVCLFACLLYH